MFPSNICCIFPTNIQGIFSNYIQGIFPIKIQGIFYRNSYGVFPSNRQGVRSRNITSHATYNAKVNYYNYCQKQCYSKFKTSSYYDLAVYNTQQTIVIEIHKLEDC